MKVVVKLNKEIFKSLAFDDKQIDDELIDALIKAGSHEYIQNSIMEIPDEELSDEEFSKELDKKILNYIDTIDKQDRNEKAVYVFKKVRSIAVRAAAVFFVLIVLAVGFVATAEAAQLQLLQMYIEHSDISSNFEFIRPSSDNETSREQQTRTLEHIFWYIPQGFEYVYENHEGDLSFLRYEDEQGNYIEIVQVQFGSLQSDTQSACNYKLEINGLICFISEHPDKTIAIFNIGSNNYNITSTLPIEDIAEIIKNINYQK